MFAASFAQRSLRFVAPAAASAAAAAVAVSGDDARTPRGAAQCENPGGGSVLGVLGDIQTKVRRARGDGAPPDPVPCGNVAQACSDRARTKRATPAEGATARTYRAVLRQSDTNDREWRGVPSGGKRGI